MRATRCSLLVLATAVVAFGAGCSSGGKGSAPSTRSNPAPTSKQSVSAARSARLLTIGSTDVERAGSKGTLSAGVRRAVLGLAQEYLNSAILAPLETGKLGAGYPTVFAPGIRAAATGADEPVLTDLSVGKTTGLNEQATPVAVSALVDSAGTLVYAATKFAVKIQATKANGTITIDRSVELTMEPLDKTWVVVAYRVNATRTAPAHKTTTTAPRRTTTSTRPRATTHATTTTTHPKKAP